MYPVDEFGRQIVVSASRPLDCTTYFTMAGDDTLIGNGKELKWDFSNTDDDITEGVPSGFKRKRIEFSFNELIYLKEGTLYWKEAPFGSYIDIYIVNKSPEIKVAHYVNKHFVMDTCAIGDEVNTEQASKGVSTDLKFWLEITVPDITGYENFKGYSELELYRENTV